MQAQVLSLPPPFFPPAHRHPVLASVPRVFLPGPSILDKHLPRPAVHPGPSYSPDLPGDQPDRPSPQQYAVSAANRPASLPRAPLVSPGNSFSRTEPDPPALVPPSPSPPQPRPPLFPPPHSAPHHQTHFASSEASYSPNIDRYAIANLPDRYLRASDKYSHNQQPLLDQRRMSEPAMYGPCGYPSSAPDLSDARYHQLQHHLPYVSPPSYPSHSSSPLHRSSITRPPGDSPWKQDRSLPLHSYDSAKLEEPLSPLNPTFSGGASSPPMGLSGVLLGSLQDYGPSPPGTGTSASSNPPPTTHLQASSPGGPSSPSNTKQYSFVPLPGNGIKKRPRRRYDEIERLYQCSWQNCAKAYGTLNHLNAHITMQKHGPKRSPNEFKELRKQWRKAKKEEAEARAIDVAGRGSHLQHPPSQHHASRHSIPDAEYEVQDTRLSFDYSHNSERPIQPIGRLNDPPDLLHESQRYGSFAPQPSGLAYPHSHAQGTSTPNIPVNRLPANSTLLTPLPGYEPSLISGPLESDAHSSYDPYRGEGRSRTGYESPGRHSDRGRPRTSYNWSQP